MAIPAAIAAVEAAKKYVPQNIPRVVIQLGIGFVVLVGGLVIWRLYKKGQQEKRRLREVQKVGAGTKEARAIEIAGLMYGAMYRGWSWFNKMIGDGTNEETLMQAAVSMNSEGIPFGLVQQKYHLVHGEDLWADIQRELDIEELALFQQALNTGVYTLDGTETLVTTSETIVTSSQNDGAYKVPPNTTLGRYRGSITRDGVALQHYFSCRTGKEYIVQASNVSFR